MSSTRRERADLTETKRRLEKEKQASEEVVESYDVKKDDNGKQTDENAMEVDDQAKKDVVAMEVDNQTGKPQSSNTKKRPNSSSPTLNSPTSRRQTKQTRVHVPSPVPKDNQIEKKKTNEESMIGSNPFVPLYIKGSPSAISPTNGPHLDESKPTPQNSGISQTSLGVGTSKQQKTPGLSGRTTNNASTPSWQTMDLGENVSAKSPPNPVAVQSKSPGNGASRSAATLPSRQNMVEATNQSPGKQAIKVDTQQQPLQDANGASIAAATPSRQTIDVEASGSGKKVSAKLPPNPVAVQRPIPGAVASKRQDVTKSANRAQPKPKGNDVGTSMSARMNKSKLFGPWTPDEKHKQKYLTLIRNLLTRYNEELKVEIFQYHNNLDASEKCCAKWKQKSKNSNKECNIQLKNSRRYRAQNCAIEKVIDRVFPLPEQQEMLHQIAELFKNTRRFLTGDIKMIHNFLLSRSKPEAFTQGGVIDFRQITNVFS